MKWVTNKQNEDVVRWTNNYVLAPKPSHEQRYDPMISEGTSIKSEANCCSCK
jgi:hypothetical protein